MKDKEKAYPLTVRCVRAYNRMGRLLLYGEMKSLSHFGVIRDWAIQLKGGGEVHIDYSIIKEIVKHELDENPDEYTNGVRED